MKTTDSDRDGALTAQEIQERLEVFAASGVPIRSFQVEFRHGTEDAKNLLLLIQDDVPCF